MLKAFALIRRLGSRSFPAPAGRLFPANENVRAARRPAVYRARHNRIALVCQWSSAGPGAVLACRWRRDAEAQSKIDPLGSPRVRAWDLASGESRAAIGGFE
jgi:hypothetical protein